MEELGVEELAGAGAFQDALQQIPQFASLFCQRRKPFIADKTVDNDFYIMTLAAVAMECKANNVHDGDIYLAVGIPVSWIREQRDSLRDYIMKQKKLRFTFNGEKYKLNMKGCFIFPQGFPALMDRLGDLKGLNMLADIGNGTMNILLMSNLNVDERKCFTEPLGVVKFKIAARNAIMDKLGKPFFLNRCDSVN